ncbi:MAG: hypothetical protein KKD44_28940 [Proteobacteria bacterium]|nr:hypothetical protein [Pseudomonadota bacterium]
MKITKEQKKTMWIIAGIIILLFLFSGNKLQLPFGSIGSSFKGESGSSGGGGGGSNAIGPCQQFAIDNTFSNWKSPINSRLNCNVFSFSDCQNKGSEVSSSSWSDILKCCVWRCKSSGDDSDGDGFSDDDENEVGTDPNDPEDYPGHRVCGKIKNPAYQTSCDQAVSCSSGTKCTFHMAGGIGGDRWCSCDTTTDFCTSLNKGYISGREVDSCSYCNTITEVCEININNDVFCCAKPTFEVGCNDIDFTKDDFDNSLKTSTSCTDDIATHVDSCSSGLLDEWYCSDAMDSCKHTFYSCESMLGTGYYCLNGACMFNPDITTCDIACAGVTGPGSDSIPFSLIPAPLTCPDYPSTQCSNGVYNIGIANGNCCCWNCN